MRRRAIREGVAPQTVGADCRRKPADDPERFAWPACGEIDLVEIWGCKPTRVATCLHTANRGPEPGENYVAKDFHVMKGRGEYNATAPGSEPWNGFHTYTLDWVRYYKPAAN